MSFPLELKNIDKYLNDNVKTKEEAIEGASYIIAEWISDNASFRKWIRFYLYNNALITSKLKKNSNDENMFDKDISINPKYNSFKKKGIIVQIFDEHWEEVYSNNKDIIDKMRPNADTKIR